MPESRPGRRTSVTVVALALWLTAGAAGAEPSPEQVEFFEKKIRPALVEHCAKCHFGDAEKVKGGLLLDTREHMRKGGDSGPAVVPGNPGQSLLLRALRYEDEELRMPPKGKLPDRVIADFETWIKRDAADPRDGGA